MTAVSGQPLSHRPMRRVVAVLTAVLCILAAPASAPAGPTVVQASWKTKPSGDMIGRLYPPDAVRREIEGKVIIRCRTLTTGILADCKVISESPKGMWFGAAALRFPPAMTMNPKTVNGRPVEGVVTIPINFRAPGGRARVQVHPLSVADLSVCTGLFLASAQRQLLPWTSGPERRWYGAAVDDALQRGLSGEQTISLLQAALEDPGAERAERRKAIARCNALVAERDAPAQPGLTGPETVR